MQSYIDHANHFWSVRIVRDDILDRETTIFFWLLHVASRQHWPESFEASTKAVCGVLQCNRQSFTRARNRLKDAGLLEFSEGNREKMPRYSFPFCYANRAQGVTRDKTIQTNRAEQTRGADAPNSTHSFEEVVSEMEKHYERRSDIRKCVEEAREYYEAKGGKLTMAKARKWIANERDPQFKPAPEPIEPEGWKELFRADFPDAPEPDKWGVFRQKYPEEAGRYEQQIAEPVT